MTKILVVDDDEDILTLLVDVLSDLGFDVVAADGGPEALPGPTGERNELSLHGRGVFLCVTAAGGPFGAYIGQIAAALAAGNAVLATPVPATPRAAAGAVRLLRRAGIPLPVLRLVSGGATGLDPRLLAEPGIDGVGFTGPAGTARAINRALAARDGPIVPLVARRGVPPPGECARYLLRFATERTVSVDTTAAGGNAALMAMEERPGRHSVPEEVV